MLNSLRKPLLALNADCCRPPSPGHWRTSPWKEKMAIEQEINRQASWDWNSVITAQVGAKRICQNCIDIVWFIMYYHASWDVLLGLYYCHASNSLGEGSCHLELTGEFLNHILPARSAKRLVTFLLSLSQFISLSLSIALYVLLSRVWITISVVYFLTKWVVWLMSLSTFTWQLKVARGIGLVQVKTVNKVEVSFSSAAMY